MSSDRILLKDPDFISMEGAEKKYGVTTEELSILITNKKLPAYILANTSSMNKAARLSKSVHRYAKITEISWSGNSVESGTALMMDETENIIIPSVIIRLHGNLYKWIMIKPKDLRSLEQSQRVLETSATEKKVERFVKEQNKKTEAVAITDKAGTKPGTVSKVRKDALAKIVLQYIKSYREEHRNDPQCNQVMIHLKKLAKDPKNKTIQDVVDGKVEWTNEKGRAKTTSSKQIQNRMTRLRTL
jgi:hypothetical protein